MSTYAGFISRRALKLNIFKLPALSRNTWLELDTSHRAAADSGFDGNVSFGKKTAVVDVLYTKWSLSEYKVSQKSVIYVMFYITVVIFKLRE